MPEEGYPTLVKKVDTSGKRAKGQYTRSDFRYDAEKDEYRLSGRRANAVQVHH